ncbi:MAG: magnesium/cobalt transporter CorA [Polyangiaceae bacterium]|jgi:magnesium transporter|nr:magnesium/cobalt transporter CorA [Polyangiaceae bacterium]
MKASILKDGIVFQTRSLQDVRQAHAAGNVMWINLERQTAETDALLQEVLAIHLLTIEDVWADGVTPKIEDFPEYLYIRVHGVSPDCTALDLELRELDILVGPRFIVVYDSADIAVGLVQDQLDRSPKLLGQGPAWLAHRVIDLAVDRFLPLVDNFNQGMEDLERDVVRAKGASEGREVLGRILAFKRSLHTLKRISIHQREILYRLSRGEFDEVSGEALHFFRDVYDHFVRVTDLAESYNELVTSSFQVYLNMQSNRMNEVMKTLTLISTIMLPLTFIAGVYGMNFEYMPELHWEHGYGFALGVMAVVATGIVVWFKRRSWL